MNLGNKLLELRKQKGLSQEDVAFELNVTRQTISKWETNQTTPDFDKIAPLCKLYEISTDELLTGKKLEKTLDEDKKITRKSSALIISVSIFLYFLAVALLILLTETKINDSIAVVVFLIICAVATCLLVYNYSVKEKVQKSKQEEKENKLYKQVENIVSSITLIIYLIVSFATMAWHITWILWIINALICEIIKLFFMLKGENIDEE